MQVKTLFMYVLMFIFDCMLDTVLKQSGQAPGLMPQTSQAMLQMQNSMQSTWNNPQVAGNGSAALPNAASVNSNLTSQIEAINAQQITLQEQIRQSEQNLNAQHNVNICRLNVFFINEHLSSMNFVFEIGLSNYFRC